MNNKVSISPDGVEYSLPKEEDNQAEFKRIQKLIKQAQRDRKEIVVVMGVGFVGAVMAAIVADTVDAQGKPSKFVIGMQRPSTRSYWKIPMLNKGISPVKAEDPEVDPMIKRCVLKKKTLVATHIYEALQFADVVIIDVQLDYSKNELGNVRNGHVEMNALEESFEIIARNIKPEALVLIETTVAPGTTEQVAFPAMRKIFRQRGIKTDPLLAHSYERVMPGRDYVASITGFLACLQWCERGSKEKGRQVSP